MRLDVALAERGLARSRSRAAELIASGRVSVDGEIATKAGARVAGASELRIADGDVYVSRAAHKLLAGLDGFGVTVEGRLALDLGASTGGFTQVLLERDAREVIALDVGHGQLVRELREDPRVRVVEGCNARELDRARLAEAAGTPEPPSLVVGDLSFISLTLVLSAIAAIAAPRAELILLIKPQFEVGRQGIRNGIVVDPELAQAAVDRVVACATGLGFVDGGVIPSPITGEHGNHEFLAYFFREASTA
ncbi:TlyA family RNA methyltransferase [Leucobacter soli]|uniref:16S/23S rRNA (Cytidine-2'-O)-methyltransferase TlyA n=2 Tax=Leucobacter soli TaxID=2812850 RepID=A0A916JWN0_9MICO|nr:16S/23S rRNA (cytidine-2'-O)-methyltransferase TlyA [Leucobacter soli]